MRIGADIQLRKPADTSSAFPLKFGMRMTAFPLTSELRFTALHRNRTLAPALSAYNPGYVKLSRLMRPARSMTACLQAIAAWISRGEAEGPPPMNKTVPTLRRVDDDEVPPELSAELQLAMSDVAALAREGLLSMSMGVGLRVMELVSGRRQRLA